MGNSENGNANGGGIYILLQCLYTGSYQNLCLCLCMQNSRIISQSMSQKYLVTEHKWKALSLPELMEFAQGFGWKTHVKEIFQTTGGKRKKTHQADRRRMPLIIWMNLHALLTESCLSVFRKANVIHWQNAFPGMWVEWGFCRELRLL